MEASVRVELFGEMWIAEEDEVGEVSTVVVEGGASLSGSGVDNG